MTTGFYFVRRFKETDYATYARLSDALGQEIVCIIERPWVEDPNHPGRRHPLTSRFVPGVYQLTRRHSPKRGYDVWWYRGVPDVSLCDEFPDAPDTTTAQMHIACFPGDLEGCQGVGSAFGFLDDPHTGTTEQAATGSHLAFAKWMIETSRYDALEITVTDEFPVAAQVAA